MVTFFTFYHFFCKMSAFEDYIEYTSDPYAQNLRIDVEDYEDLREHEEDYGVSIPRNILLDRQNPLEALKEKTFRYFFKRLEFYVLLINNVTRL